MKTKMLIKAFAFSLLAMLFFAPTQAKAQVMNPYDIMNNTPCQLTVKYTVFTMDADGNCIPCDIGTVPVPPGPPATQIFWDATCSGCAILIEITHVNGVAVVPPIVAGLNTPPIPPHGTGTDPSGCLPAGAMINLMVHPHGADIHP